MRRLERQITCEDLTGRRYVLKVFVTTEPVLTPYGAWEADGAVECWLDTGTTYQPVNVVEPFSVFRIVADGQLLTLRRVGEAGRLPSFLRRTIRAAS